MKYEKEIDQFLRDVIYEDWMNEEEYQEVLVEAMEQLGLSKKIINDNLEIGVLNGYPVQMQLELALKYCK